MFFELNISGDNQGKFSYIISKNPENSFEREVGNRGKIGARFKLYMPTHSSYKGYLENYSLPFIKLNKANNADVYVNAEQYSVCPYNLTLLDRVFRSVLRGKYQNISEEEFNRKYEIEFKIGPFSLFHMEPIIEAFEHLGYIVSRDSYEERGHILDIRGNSDITSFLQKVYIICYAYTNHLRFMFPQKQDIDKYFELSKDWIDIHPKRNLIVNRLSKSKRLINQFEVGLLENAGVEDTKSKADEITKLSNRRASDLRYKTIANYVNSDSKVLDLGCGNGNLFFHLLNQSSIQSYLGVDSYKSCVNKAYMVGKKLLKKRNLKIDFKTISGSILYLDLSLCKDIDCVILCEVLEHFNPDEVLKAMDLIFKGVAPKQIILSTPNKDYNANFDLKGKEFRHYDHKFELTKREMEYMVSMFGLRYNYDYHFVEGQYSSDSTEEDLGEILYTISDKPYDSLSHIVVFEKKGEIRVNEELQKQSENTFSEFILDVSGYKVKSNTIREGSASFNHKIDPRWIISLAPTMSPVDSNNPDFIEHPKDAIQYYCDRGVYNLVAETKYMGSRGTIVATSNEDISQRLFGSSDCIKIYSRSGYDFFREKEIVDQVYEDIKSYMKLLRCNVIALDAEVLPWSYKAEGMIGKKFLTPGVCAYVDKIHTNRSFKNEKLYLDILKNFSSSSDIQIYPFSIILRANFDDKRFKDVHNGYYTSHVSQLQSLKKLADISDIFRKVRYLGRNLKYMYCVEDFVNLWEEMGNKGLEGIVIKPAMPTQFLSSGRYIQPALKCRTKDYLRLIYGIDYLEPENIALLKRRNTATKRGLAMQQYELSQRILYSFLNRDDTQRMKYIFGFFGMDNVSRIDKTL